MVEKKLGKVIYRHDLSPILAIFRLVPETGHQFPEYEAGQFIALRRPNCRLTKKVTGADGQPSYVPDVDESGNQLRGSVSHSYSISSAPFETVQEGYLEFYVILEMHQNSTPGRLTESLWQVDPGEDDTIIYFNKITGDFTLNKRVAEFDNVVLVGTGSGLAPFASIIKQLHFEATHGVGNSVRYTLLHANRGYQELGYHEELSAIATSQKFDFMYVPCVSRPTSRDYDDPSLGKGRANNVLRFILEMSSKEEEELGEASARGEDTSRAKALLERTVRPKLPEHIPGVELRERMPPGRTVLMCCGNAASMSDIQHIAEISKIRFEKEDW
jgi:ferredoxin-NADP reductase